MVTRYRATWQQEDLNEFALSHTVRYRDPLNKKRFAIPYKDAAKAQEKMAQLKRDGVNEIEITKDILRGKFKEDASDYLKSKLNSTQIQNIKKTWQTKKASDVTPAVKAMIKNMDIPTQLAIKQANIPHLSKLVEGKDDAYAIGMSVAKKKYNDEPPLDKKTIEKGHEIAKSILKKEDASKDAENIAKLRTRQMALQTKLRDLDVGDPKDKTPIAITKNDIENIQMKMDQIRSKTKKEEKIHPAKALIEKITAVQNKAKKTGMPYSVLKKVYNRGMAAWKGGHRPGTTPQQWAMARVNSFVTKSSGTWGGADKDLAKQVRGSKK